MGTKKARGWCDICRDEKPDVTCIERDCRKSFHIDCLRNTGQLYEDDDFSSYLCPGCRDNEENDAFCYKCKSEGDENSTLLMCDGCPRSVHLECLGLKEVPNTEIWMCPVCAPPVSQSKETSTKISHSTGVRAKLGNVDICYVCQKGGKLLCCDVCDQSFHPKCIDPDFLESTLLDDGAWSCPICRGEDPLKHMGHKRLTRAERQIKSREWQQCVRRESRRCRANRDRFLYDSREALRPFVSADIIARLKKSAALAAKIQNEKKLIKKKLVQRSNSNSSSGDNTSQNIPSTRQKRVLQKTLNFSEDEELPFDGRRVRRRVLKEEELSAGSLTNSKASSVYKSSPTSDNAKEDVKDETQSTTSVKQEEEEVEESEHGQGNRLNKNEGDFNGADSLSSSNINASSSHTDTMPVSECNVLYQEESLLQEAEAGAVEAKSTLLREGVELKHYQRWGVNWLLDAFFQKAGAILADEMGLGKTIQTLAFLSALKALSISGPHLVVVPLSTVGNWAREIRRFTPNLTVTKICGSRQEREHAMADGVAMDGIYDIFVTTYETAVTEEWFFTDRFKWQCVILDEAHRIKNESARIRHSLDRVDCNMRVLLTGTPLQNNIKELFTLLNFLFPDIIKNSSLIEAAFQAASSTSMNKKPDTSNRQHTGVLSRHANQNSNYQNTSVLSTSVTSMDNSTNDSSLMMLNNPAAFDESKVEAVTCLLSKLMLRRTKDLVVRLPSKIEHDIWLPLSPAGALWYRRLLEVTADADEASSIRKLLGAVIKMRICCCHPRGLVSRDDQLENLLETIYDAGGSFSIGYDQLQEQAQELRHTSQGWEHVCNSTKLLFLDKLLRQLHSENMMYCEHYAREYEMNKANRLRKMIKEKREALEALMNSTQHLPASVCVPAATVEAMFKLERDLSTLSKPESENGGLDALIENKCALTPPAENPELFVQSLLPIDASSELKAVMEQKLGLKAASVAAAAMSSRSTHNNHSTAAFHSMFSAEDEDSNKATIRPHKVLVFTQFQLVLDELSAYCAWRGWSYMRLDGSTNKMIRELDTREFNSPDSNHFVYLISTRAGGLGINLVTANHVVMYDEDWNPFVDLQAVDRAHRIGQLRNVHIWRLMLEWTVEERMAIRRQQKLKLDRLLIQANVDNIDGGSVNDPEGQHQHDEKLSTDEIRRLIQYGRTALMKVSVTNELEHLPLEVIVNRKRRELKEMEVEGSFAQLLDVCDSSTTTVSATSPRSPSISDSDAEHITNKSTKRRSIDMHEAIMAVEGPQETNENIEEDDGLGSTVDDDSEHGASQPDSNISSVRTPPLGATTEVLNDSVDDSISTASALYRGNRPRRERRKPKTVYNPTLQIDKLKTEIKIVRERKCFRCGGGGPLGIPSSGSSKVDTSSTKKATLASGGDDEKNTQPDVLVGCMRCPKVYHRESCLGLDKVPPRSWMCPWHECCVCFRRAASAGGLLIHCAECPTAFCFDCFPPEYRRYTPPPQFFEDLQKRGWTVTPQKLVTFLCSKCKALKEQERRRHLTKQQLDAEMKKSKEDSARVEARKRQQQTREERMLAKDRKQKQLDEKRKFLEQKKKIDEQDKQLQDNLRQAIEKLYPKKYLELLQNRRQILLDEHLQQQAPLVSTLASHEEISSSSNKLNAVIDDAKVVDNKEDKPINVEEHAEGDNLDGLSGTINPAILEPSIVTDVENSAAGESLPVSKNDSTQGELATATAISFPKKELATSKGSKKRLIIPDRIRPPSETVKLCENCQLPMHEINQCPFPLELKRQKIETGAATVSPVVLPKSSDNNIHNKTSNNKSNDHNAVVISTPPPNPSSSSSSSLAAASSLLDDDLDDGERSKAYDVPPVSNDSSLSNVFVVLDLSDHEGQREPESGSKKAAVEIPSEHSLSFSFNSSINNSTLAPSANAADISGPSDDENYTKSVKHQQQQYPVNDGDDDEDVRSNVSCSSSAILPPPPDCSTANDSTTVAVSSVAVPLADDKKGSKSTKIATATNSSTGSLKSKFRVLCSLCQHPSAPPHCRKHCDKLTEEDKAEYESRRAKYSQLIDLLKKEVENHEQPIPIPTKLAEVLASSTGTDDVPSHSNLSDKFLDLTRKQLNYSADSVIQRLMREAGLHACIPKSTLENNKKNATSIVLVSTENSSGTTSRTGKTPKGSGDQAKKGGSSAIQCNKAITSYLHNKPQQQQQAPAADTTLTGSSQETVETLTPKLLNEGKVQHHPHAKNSANIASLVTSARSGKKKIVSVTTQQNLVSSCTVEGNHSPAIEDKAVKDFTPTDATNIPTHDTGFGDKYKNEDIDQFSKRDTSAAKYDLPNSSDITFKMQKQLQHERSSDSVASKRSAFSMSSALTCENEPHKKRKLPHSNTDNNSSNVSSHPDIDPHKQDLITEQDRKSSTGTGRRNRSKDSIVTSSGITTNFPPVPANATGVNRSSPGMFRTGRPLTAATAAVFQAAAAAALAGSSPPDHLLYENTPLTNASGSLAAYQPLCTATNATPAAPHFALDPSTASFGPQRQRTVNSPSQFLGYPSSNNNMLMATMMMLPSQPVSGGAATPFTYPHHLPSRQIQPLPYPAYLPHQQPQTNQRLGWVLAGAPQQQTSTQQQHPCGSRQGSQH